MGRLCYSLEALASFTSISVSKASTAVLRYGRAAIQVGMESNADGVVVGATLEAEVFIA